MKARDFQRRVLLRQLAIVGFFLGSWQLVSSSGLVFDRLFPPPSRVFLTAVDFLREGYFLPHLLFSLYEIVWGFALGATAGVVVGLLLGVNRILRAIFEPIVHWLAPVPKIIVYPLFLWFLGIGAASRIAMGVASAFFPVALYTVSGVRQVKPVLVDAARLLGAGSGELVTKIYIPAILPSLWLGLRLGAAVSIVGILLAETKLSQQGVGFLIIEHYNHFQITEMYAVLMLVFLMAIGLNSFLGWMQGRIAVLRQSYTDKPDY